MSVLPSAGFLTWLQDTYLLTAAVHERNQRSGVSKTTTRKTSSISEFHTTIKHHDDDDDHDGDIILTTQSKHDHGLGHCWVQYSNHSVSKSMGIDYDLDTE